MKKVLLTVAICLLGISNYAQEQIISELKKAYEEKSYDLIISKHSDKVNEYPAEAVYYIGMAYYMKADDNNAIKIMDISIKKDKSNPDAHFIKGMTYNYMGQFDKAITSFNTAIELDSKNTNYFSGLGDSYFSQKEYNKALIAYTTATEKNDPTERAFVMIPQVYVQLNQLEKALEAFYKSSEIISKESGSYITILYNIGLYEYLNKNYDKSEIAYKELIEIAPNDYQSYAKLIQVYYGKKEYEKAKPLREKLYQAYKGGELEGNLKSMFCFDQFEWNGKLILAFERFAVKEGQLYYKHVFYIPNEKGETEFTIQTENSPVSVELGGPKYVLGMDKGGAHSTFRYGFNEDLNYEDLKKTVLLVLEEKIEAGASSRRKNK
ncbi:MULTISPECIES: tetratricopeptide repeat protein [Flavobacterium]|uniref:Tetratricopeptide repeat protein n=1 Tax=Flavobacterium jumunjinense TaxID=998845 RepID=A0ABV5GK72_9FLAO|nr:MULTISPECIES: tetratricopeptide repeat protein [Flavobacterium]